MATKKTKPTIEQRPMACVQIGYHDYLVPFADATRLVEIMARAVECNATYGEGHRRVFEVKPDAGAPHTMMELVKPSQLVRLPPQRDNDRDGVVSLLGHEPLKIVGPR